MISYSRIGSKVWKSICSFSPTPSTNIITEELSYLDFQITQWQKTIPPHLQLPTAAAPQASSRSPGPPQAPQKKKKGKRRGKTSSRPRGGKALKAAGGNSYVSDTQRLRKKLVYRADFYQTGSYSIEQNGSRVSTGWQGRNPPPRARSEIRRLYGTKGMQSVLETFFPVYAHA